MEVQDLSRRRSYRRLPLDSHDPAVAPQELGKPATPGSAADCCQGGLGDLPFVQGTEIRMHPQSHAGASRGVGFLDDLVVDGRAAEARGQHLLQDADDVDVEKRDASSGQLLEAANAAYTQRPSRRLHRTTA